MFQCSSASRKFLNYHHSIISFTVCQGFSALQRAENSSIEHAAIRALRFVNVSVLFSEPKIPQSREAEKSLLLMTGFSALQRAENSSIVHVHTSNSFK
mgnify:CR=1 FL=1